MAFAETASSSAPTFLNLDWRTGPSNRDLITSLTHQIDQFDSKGQFECVSSTTLDRRLIQIHDPSGSEPRMYKHQARKVVRQLPTAESHVDYQHKYSSWNVHILNQIIGKVQAKTVYKKRLFFYETAVEERGLGAQKVSDIFVDISLTNQVHPCRLGLLMEPKSKVYVPGKCQIELDLVQNIFSYYDTGRTKRETLAEAKAHMVPGMVKGLRVVPSGQAVRAVVVSEHRNIVDALLSVSGDTAIPGLEGVILVMVSSSYYSVTYLTFS